MPIHMMNSFLAVNAPDVAVDAVEFSVGTEDALSWASPGFTAADSDAGSVVVWYRLLELPTVAGFSKQILDIATGGATSTLRVFLSSADNTFQVRSIALAANLDIRSTTAETLDGNWHCLMCSWDADVAGGGAGAVSHCYRDGVDVKSTPTYYTSVPDITNASSIGSLSQGTGTFFFEDQCALIWYNPGETLDFSDSAVRGKFYNAGKFVDVGSDGSTPTGSAPRLCLKGNATAFKTNVGAGGNPTDNIGANLINATGPTAA